MWTRSNLIQQERALKYLCQARICDMIDKFIMLIY